MALIEFHIPEVTEAVKRRLEDGLEIIGAQGVSWASDQLRSNGSVVTSNLVNSLAWSTDKFQSAVNGSPTDGEPLETAGGLTVRIGSTVVYAARVEFGFVGKDKRGRTYNQGPKSYLRASLTTNKGKILGFFKSVLNG
jgi:hypothetical protein